MGKAMFLLTKLHSLAWPGLTLAYPLYASMVAMEGGDASKPDIQQWLAYWIIYALLFPLEMLLQPLLQWTPIWDDLKLVFVAWLVLPQFGGACFLYEKFVRVHARRLIGRRDHPRQQTATFEPSQTLRREMPNARYHQTYVDRRHNSRCDTSTHHQFDTDSRWEISNTHRSNTGNVRDKGSHSSTGNNVRDNIQNIGSHSSNTNNVQDNVRDIGSHSCTTNNVRDTNARGGRPSPPGGLSSPLVHKPGKRRSLFPWF